MTLICATTILRARDITVVETWQIEHPKSAECPSIAVLQRDGAIKPDQALDPWKHAYEVMCSHDAEGFVVGFVVGSAGDDGRWGTADDLIVPSR